MGITEVTTENFDTEVLQSEKPVLIDFWADWCNPCKMLSPLVEEIANEHEEIKVCKVNLEENEDLAVRFKIHSIPTLLIFKNGELTNQSIGFVPKDTILSLL